MFVAALIAASLSTSVDTRTHHPFYRHIGLVRSPFSNCAPVPNGRPWVSAPEGASSCDVPGPLAYGAAHDDRSRFYVRFGHTRVAFSPWQRLEGRAYRFAENARQQWLKDNGYVGGVRTIVNDALRAPQSAAAEAPSDVLVQEYIESTSAPASVTAPAVIVPRATITLPPELPRFRKRMHVQYDRGICAPAYCSAGVVTLRGDANATGVIRVVPAAASTTITPNAVAMQ